MAATVAPSNTEQLRAWDGDEGAYWAANAIRFDRSASAQHERLMAAASIAAADQVLDIGCGTGQTTRDAARAASSGHALGVDLSSEMLDYARKQAEIEGVTNASFAQADAQIHRFDAAQFDVAISRSAAMFFGDLNAAFANIATALRPGGRIVLTTWQPLVANEWIREITAALAAGRDMQGPPPDGQGPFALSNPDRVRAVLTGAGFTDVDLEPLVAPMWFGDDADDAHGFVLGLMGWMVRDLDHDDQSRAIDNLRSTMAAHETSGGVTFGSGAWLVHARRT